ncbi:MAG: hypothetical protein JWN48_5736 [Myxococcaceae bacterium]|nr:hypothetical protein [Myxococcaceae bacterium]
MTGMSPQVQATVVRYDLAQLRWAQLLVPLALILTVVARAVPEAPAITVALAVQMAAVVQFIRARKKLAAQPLKVMNGKLQLGTSGHSIEPTQVSDWITHGFSARLFGPKDSWRLTADNSAALEDTLRRVFGRSLQLRRRGSPRARMFAAATFFVGLLVAVCGAYTSVMPMFIPGLVMALVSIPVFAALSQRITSGA